MLQWWNRYLSPTVGGELFFVSATARGELPYRDYFFPGQPGMVLTSVLIAKLFGPRLIVFWALGVVLRLAAAACLYCWLAKWFRPAVAAGAVILTFIISSSDIADFPAFYNHQALAFGLFGAYCAMKALDARHGYLWVFLGGLFLALNFWTKQTTGVIVDFAVLVAFAFAGFLLHGVRWSFTRTFVLTIGLALPVAAGLGWLYYEQLLPLYFDQVYFSGPASKGGLVASLLRPVSLTLENPALYWPALLALVGLCVDLYERARGRFGLGPWLRSIAYLGLAFSLALVMLKDVALSIYASFQARELVWVGPYVDTRTLLLSCAYLALVGNLVAIAFVLGRVLLRRGDRRIVDFGLLAAVGFASAYSLSISWAAFETMTFPGLALLFALLFERIFAIDAERASRRIWVGVCVVLVVLAGWRKQVAPFTWGFLSEPPVAQGKVPVSEPALLGFHLSPDTARLFDEVPRLIRAHSREDDKILIYPHMPIFYALTDRRQVGVALAHWMDVCPDRIALHDAEAVRANPPAVIVSMEMSDEVYTAQEAQFRSGQSSGQRKMVETLAALTPQYNLVGEFQAPGQRFPIKVWAKQR